MNFEKIRVEKIKALREQGVEPYPTRNSVADQIADVVRDYSLNLKKEHPEKSARR